MRYLASIAALGLLVAFHELGHLLLARLFRVRVDKFAIGFGPSLLSFKARGIEWVIGAIPLGGYVRIRGMNPHEDGVDDADSFAKAKAYKRALILGGGSLANYLLAVVVMFFMLLVGTHVPVPQTVGVLQPGQEAARVLQPGDVIVAINGQRITEWAQIVEKVNDSPNVNLTFTINRGGTVQDVVLRPRLDASGTGRIGAGQQYALRQYPAGQAVVLAFGEVHARAMEGFRLLWRLVSGKSGVQLASPVMIVKQGADAASGGIDAFLRVVVSISVALAVFNLLPFPALDGGRLLFVAIEAATGRPVNPKIETVLHSIGFLLLITLLIFVAMRDVANLFGGDKAATGPPAAGVTDGGVDAGSDAG